MTWFCPIVPSRLERLWAYLTIQQLLEKAERTDSKAEKKAAEEKALQMALKYSFVTKLTSMVVTKPPTPPKPSLKEKEKKKAEAEEVGWWAAGVFERR